MEDSNSNYLTPESAKELVDKGMLDKTYIDLVTQHAQENAQMKDAVAQGITNDIQNDPEAADIAHKVLDNVQQAAGGGDQGQAQPAATPDDTTGANPWNPLELGTTVANFFGADKNKPQSQGAPPPPQDTTAAAPTAAPTVTPKAPEQQAPNPQAEAAVAQVRQEQLKTASQMQGAANLAAKTGNVPGVYGTMAAGEKRLAELEDRLGQIGQQAAGAHSAAAGAAAAASKQLGLQAQQNATASTGIMQAQQQKADEYEAALKKFDTLQIDPNRYWGQMSTQQHIIAGIGMMLSAAGGGHAAMDVIDNAIKQDIEVQKANFELKAKGLEGRKTLFDIYHQMTGDKFTAQQLATASLMDQAKLQIEAAAQGAASDEAKASAIKGMADIEVMRNKALAPILSGDALLSAMVQQPGQAGGAQQQGQGQAPLPAGQTMNPVAAPHVAAAPVQQPAHGVGILNENFNPLLLPKEESDKVVPGLGMANSTESRTLMEDQIRRHSALDRNLTELIKLREDNGVVLNPSSEVVGKARILGTAVERELKSGNRELTPATQAVLDSGILTDPLGSGGVTGGRVSAKILRSLGAGDPVLGGLKEYRDQIKSEFADNLNSHMRYVYPEVYNHFIKKQGLKDEFSLAPGQ